MAKQRRARILTNCVADKYAYSGERIIEFSMPNGGGGLISFRDREGGPIVELYRLDPEIRVIVSAVNLSQEEKEPTPVEVDGISVRQTSCRHCGLDIEGVRPFRRGQWRDRGNNSRCNDGKHQHAPMPE